MSGVGNAVRLVFRRVQAGIKLRGLRGGAPTNQLGAFTSEDRWEGGLRVGARRRRGHSGQNLSHVGKAEDEDGAHRGGGSRCKGRACGENGVFAALILLSLTEKQLLAGVLGVAACSIRRTVPARWVLHLPRVTGHVLSNMPAFTRAAACTCC